MDSITGYRHGIRLHRRPDHWIGSIGPALGEGRALAQALGSIAQQPDEASTITRTLFVGLAMVESTAIYCFVIALIIIFANPFWDYVISQAGG